MKITIIGLGLIGGSLAKAFAKENHKIYAADKNAESLSAAIADKTIAGGSDTWIREMNGSDAVFICTPVGAAAAWLRFLANKNVGVIADAGSTKGEITKIASAMKENFVFAGAHPMSGSEQSGYKASRADLFENTYFIITPTSKSTPKAVQTLKDLAESIGAIPLEMTAKRHDGAVAAVSHLPHILAAVLMNTVSETDEGYLRLAAGGFRDVTRIAASDPVMWRDIVFSNRSEIEKITEKFTSQLHNFCKKAAEGDKEWIENFFARSKRERDLLPQKAAGLSQKTYECILDIPDRVGVLAEITRILSENGINIKNMYVAGSREFYGGALVMSFSSKSDADRAQTLLKNASLA